MKKKILLLSKFASFKIVLVYAIVSAVYIFTSDFFLEIFIADSVLISKLQTLKGLAFILITSILLHALVKRNFEKISNYYQEVINAKQQSDVQSKQSKQEYISLFNHSPLPMWIFDKETFKYLHVNEMACTHYGFSKEEYLSMTINDSHPIEVIPQMETVLNKSLLNVHPPYSALMRHRKKNQDIIIVKIKTSEVTFEGRNGIMVSAEDVTTEQETQKQLHETNFRLQIASDIANLGYWTHDLVKSEIIWSDQMHKIFDTNPETFPLALEEIKKRFQQDEMKKFDTSTFSNINNSAIIEGEQQIITNTGKTKWILERIHLIRDRFNEPIKFEGIAFDITNRKIHEQAIWDSNERFKTLTKATTEAIIDWDIDNDTIFFGEGFKTIFGHNTFKANKNLWKKNIHPKDRRRVIQTLNKALKCPNQEGFNAKYRFLKANKEIALIQHKGIFLRNHDGKVIHIIGAMIDLTESLGKTNKIELQDQALRDISWTQSHIVRAPLANLLGLIHLLKENQQLGLNDDKLINHISDSAEKLDRVIHDIVKKTSELTPS